MPSLQIIYASTSGHTEYVVDQVKAVWPGAESVRAEQANAEDLLKGGILLLASGSWNTGGIEGQMNPYMHRLLKEQVKDIDLQGKKVLIVSLGDHRYHYTCGSADHMKEFVETHGGKVFEPILKIVNEPYGQEETVKSWVKDVMKKLGNDQSPNHNHQ